MAIDTKQLLEHVSSNRCTLDPDVVVGIVSALCAECDRLGAELKIRLHVDASPDPALDVALARRASQTRRSSEGDSDQSRRREPHFAVEDPGKLVRCGRELAALRAEAR